MQIPFTRSPIFFLAISSPTLSFRTKEVNLSAAFFLSPNHQGSHKIWLPQADNFYHHRTTLHLRVKTFFSSFTDFTQFFTPGFSHRELICSWFSISSLRSPIYCQTASFQSPQLYTSLLQFTVLSDGTKLSPRPMPPVPLASHSNKFMLLKRNLFIYEHEFMCEKSSIFVDVESLDVLPPALFN